MERVKKVHRLHPLNIRTRRYERFFLLRTVHDEDASHIRVHIHNTHTGIIIRSLVRGNRRSGTMQVRASFR